MGIGNLTLKHTKWALPKKKRKEKPKKIDKGGGGGLPSGYQKLFDNLCVIKKIQLKIIKN
jgi:hypothetical protein